MIAKCFILSLFCALVIAKSVGDPSTGSKFNINDFLSNGSGSGGASLDIQGIIGAFNKPPSDEEIANWQASNGPPSAGAPGDGPAINEENNETTDSDGIEGDQEAQEPQAAQAPQGAQGGAKFDWQALLANLPSKSGKNKKAAEDV